MEALRLYELSEAGADGYPLAWHETIKHLVRQLAGHRCVRCGHPYRSGHHGRGEWTACDEQCTHRTPFRCRPKGTTRWYDDGHPTSTLIMAGAIVNQGFEVEALWRILTVHHFDGDKLNCRWWNLGALCQRCHLSIQGRVKLHVPYLFEHSEWFKPYVAGYYALALLREDLTREEVAARLDELLARGRGMEAASV